MSKFRKVNSEAEWPKGTTDSYVTRHGRSEPTSFPGRVGFAVVLYKGWRNPETLRNRCRQDDVDVALQLDPPVFYAAKYRFSIDDDSTPTEKLITGPQALLAFIFIVNEELQSLTHVGSNIFRRYVLQEPPT